MQDEGEDDGEPGPGGEPEAGAGALARAQDGGEGGRGGEDGDDHRAVGGAAGDEREAGEEREADDDARGDDGQPARLGGGGAGRADGREVGGGEAPGDGGAAEGDQPRVEALQRELRRREGEREGQDPEAAEEQSEPGRWPWGAIALRSPKEAGAG